MKKLNGNIHLKIFCYILIDSTFLQMNYKLLNVITAELVRSLKIQESQSLLEEAWKPYTKNLDTIFTNTTFYECQMRYLSDQRSPWKCVRKEHERHD